MCSVKENAVRIIGLVFLSLRSVVFIILVMAINKIYLTLHVIQSVAVRNQ